MTRLGFCGALVFAGASMMAAQAAAPQRAARRVAESRQTFQPPQTFQKYCFECHGGTKRKGDVSIERLIRQSAQSSVGAYWEEWNKVAEMLETRRDAASRRGGAVPDRRRTRGGRGVDPGDPGRV